MLNDSHKKILLDSSVDLDFAEEAGLKSLCAEESMRLIGHEESGLAFPFYDLKGRELGYRLKLDNPIDGQKYLQKKGANTRIFFVKKDIDRLQNPRIPIIISEGERAVLSAAYNIKECASLGPTGCWNWVEAKTEALAGLSEDKKHQLASIFNDIDLGGRKVIFCPDTDFFTSSNVHAAGIKFITRMLEAGAYVSLIKLSSENKVATDDYIAKHGADALKQLFDMPCWEFLPEGEGLGCNADLKKTVLWSNEARAKAIKAHSQITSQPIKDVRNDYKKYFKQWNKLKPRDKFEPKKGEITPIRWDNTSESTLVLTVNIADRTSRIDEVYYHERENVIRTLGCSDEKIIGSGKSLSTYLATRVPFAMGWYNDAGDFIVDKYTRLAEGDCQSIFDNKGLFKSFKRIDKVYNTPFIHKTDDSYELILEPGYHADKKAFLSCEKIDPTEGTKHLDFGIDYPFSTNADRTNFIAFCLQGFIRSMFLGSTPCFLIRANTQDCGKTRSARAISYLFSGKDFGSATLYDDRSQREAQTSLIAKLKSADTIVFDNLKHTISATFIDRITTQKYFAERESHSTVDFKRDTDYLVGFTVNNEGADADILTRSIVINLHSSKRGEKKEIDDWVLENRNAILAELSYMIQVWIDKGCPIVTPKKYKGKFHKWAAFMNGILTSNGYTDFLANAEDWAKIDSKMNTCLEAMYDEADKSDEKKTQFLSLKSWAEKIQMVNSKFFEKETTPHRKAMALLGPIGSMVGNEYPLETETGTATIKVDAEFCKHRKTKTYAAAIIDNYGPETDPEKRGLSGGCGSVAGVGNLNYRIEKDAGLNSLQNVCGGSGSISVINHNKKIEHSPCVSNEDIKNPEKVPQLPQVEAKSSESASKSMRRLVTPSFDDSWKEVNSGNFEYTYSFQSQNYKSQEWNGEKLGPAFSYDIETNEVKEGTPTTLVMAAAFDGEKVYVIKREDIKRFFEVNHDNRIIAHNAAFDLYHTSTHLGDPMWLYENRDRTTDTFLLSRLESLGYVGHCESGMHGLGKSVRKHLNVTLPKEVTIDGKKVRVTYAYYLGKIDKMPKAYLHYLAYDVISTFALEKVLSKKIDLVSPDENKQGHDNQLKFACTAYIMSQAGCAIDKDLVDHYSVNWHKITENHKNVLESYGYHPGGKGNQKELQRILGEIEKEYEIELPRSVHKVQGEQYSTKQDYLKEFIDISFIDAYLGYKKATKITNDFLKRLGGKKTLYTRFNTMMRSGRWSTSPNTQNIPKPNGDIDLRKVFIAEPGCKIVAADYVSAELVTLAMILLMLFPKKMQHLYQALVDGKDLHRLVASTFYGIKPEDVTAEQRQLGKLANFGFAGGMTARAMVANAKDKYGLVITLEESEKLRKAWLDTYPELYDFFDLADKLDAELAVVSHPNDQMPKGSSVHIMRSILAGRTETLKGREFEKEEIDWAWENATKLLSKYPQLRKFKTDILSRIPSLDLSFAYKRLLTNDLTLCSRRRAGCSKNNFLNTFFQGLAADIINTAADDLTRLFIETGSSSRIVNAVHDELVFQVREEDLDRELKNIEEKMVGAASAYCKEVPMNVEFTVGDSWVKG